MAQSKIYTYHCICWELMLATFVPLENLPKRKADGAAICKITDSDLPVPSGVVLSGSRVEANNPMILKLEDGFEKRYGLQCRRCDLQIGYYLDKSQFDEKEHGIRADVMYILRGGLQTTDEMNSGKNMGKEIELKASSEG